mmetsp:Transcript_22802/g.31278  ORF Transcript_22802/g.31278 Transcript_22802/m.31278 type:complete len:208 (+) Transcript_22802:22-645(+)
MFFLFISSAIVANAAETKYVWSTYSSQSHYINCMHNEDRLGVSKLLKCLPTFVIGGTQKSGSTVLAALLSTHNSISISQKKEVHFFDKNSNYERGLKNYLKSFAPIKIGIHSPDFHILNGEATPSYIASRNSCQRIKEDLPYVRLIVLLRDPVNRAYSEYQMKIRRVRQQIHFFQEIRSHQHSLFRCFVSVGRKSGNKFDFYETEKR